MISRSGVSPADFPPPLQDARPAVSSAEEEYLAVSRHGSAMPPQLHEQVVAVIGKPKGQRSNAEVDAIVPWLRRKGHLLQSLTHAMLADIVRNCDYQKAGTDDVIIKQSEQGDCLFIILRGTVSVFIDPTKDDEERPASPHKAPQRPASPAKPKPDKPVRSPEAASAQAPAPASPSSSPNEEASPEDHPGENSQNGFQKKPLDRSIFGKFVVKFDSGKCIGEVALVNEDSVRNATIIADEDTDLLVVSRTLYNSTLKEVQEKEYGQRRDFVQRHPLFRHWQPKLGKLLEMSLLKEVYTFDSTIVRQGQPYSGLYFIIRGQAKVLLEPARHPQQFKHMTPFNAHDDVYALEFNKTVKTRQFSNAANTAPVRIANVDVRRHQGYAAAEKLSSQRQVELCHVDRGEVVGDVELVMGLETYMQTVKCTAETEVFILTSKNIERLIARRNPETLKLLKMAAETKLRSRMQSQQGANVPLLSHLLFQCRSEVVRAANKPAPVREFKGVPDKEALFRHLLAAFVNNRAELCEPLVPGAVYFREKMREKAKIRELDRQRRGPEKAKKGNPSRSVRRPPSAKARTTKHMKLALRKQEEIIDKINTERIIKEIRQLERKDVKFESHMLKKQRQHAEKKHLSVEDTTTCKPELGKTSLTRTVNDTPERTNTFVTELNRSEPNLVSSYLSRLSEKDEEAEMKDSRGVRSATSKLPPSGSSPPLPPPQQPDSAPPPVPPLGYRVLPPLNAATAELKEGNLADLDIDAVDLPQLSERERSRLEHLQAAVARRTQQQPTEDQGYRDWETSDRSLSYLEARVDDFSVEQDGHKPPRPLKPAPLRRFDAAENYGEQPRPGGKVFIKRKPCGERLNGFRNANHEHERYHVVSHIPHYDTLMRHRKALHVVLDDCRATWTGRKHHGGAGEEDTRSVTKPATTPQLQTSVSASNKMASIKR